MPVSAARRYYIADAVKRAGSLDADRLVDALEKTGLGRYNGSRSRLTEVWGRTAELRMVQHRLEEDHLMNEKTAKVVLVVDDEAMVRMLAVDLFEEMGCEVLEAGSAYEALARLEQRPDVSLMFTDCRMPGMSGPELADVAAKRWPNLRIVLVTGYHNMQAPGWPVVWKPYDARTIERVVNDGC